MSGEAPRGKLKIESDGPSQGRFRTAFWTFVIISVIVLIAGWAISRTESFHKMVVEHYSDKLGMAVTVGSARIDLPYNLVVEELNAVPVDAQIAGLTVSRLELPLYRFWDLGTKVEGAELRLQMIGGGDWLPSRFRALGRLQTEAQLTEFTRRYASSHWLEGANCRVTWYEKDGDTVMRSVGALSFVMRSDSIEGHELLYYRLRGTDSVPGRYDGRGLDREWFATSHNSYITLLNDQDPAASAQPVGDVKPEEGAQ